MQWLLNRSLWDPDAMRDDLFAYVAEHFGPDDGVLIVDETGFLKKGVNTAGVQRQYSGTTGRTENCQRGVFLAYMPKPRLVPGSGSPPTPLGLRMPDRAIAAGLPARWATADEACGQDSKFRTRLEQHRIGYVLVVPPNQRIATAMESFVPFDTGPQAKMPA
jgi:SRSO17 transposase